MNLQTIIAVLVAVMLIILQSDRISADDISVSGSPGILIVNSALAGFEPDAVNDVTTTYDVSITTDGKKITGEIDSAMPAHTVLEITMVAPPGAGSTGQVTLSTAAQDLVTGLVNGTDESGLGITYEFTATVAAGVVSSSSKTVTFTIADGS